MNWSVFQSELSNLFEHPIIKAIVAAVLTLLATPTTIIVAVLMFWTLNFFAELIMICRRKDLRIFDFELLDFWVRMALEVFVFLGLTIIANLTGAKFVQWYAATAICVTEFWIMMKYLYGPKRASSMVSYIATKTGIDLHIHENSLDPNEPTANG